MQKHIYDQSRIAMERWAEDQAQKIHNMAFSPRIAWQSVYKLANGESAYHKNLKTMSLRKPDGTLARNDNENAEILKPHFQQVFNNNREVNWTVLDELEQHKTLHELDNDISYEEFEEAWTDE